MKPDVSIPLWPTVYSKYTTVPSLTNGTMLELIHPADAASRGLTAHQLVHDSCWLNGPEFLSDSYINALRRFLAERGPVRQIRSDRSTNFVGAKQELVDALKEMDNEKVSSHLLRENCDWINVEMNVPSASHMG